MLNKSETQTNKQTKMKKTTTQSFIIIKLFKTSYEEKILKVAEEK